jgi:hypothetical protein
VGAAVARAGGGGARVAAGAEVAAAGGDVACAVLVAAAVALAVGLLDPEPLWSQLLAPSSTGAATAATREIVHRRIAMPSAHAVCDPPARANPGSEACCLHCEGRAQSWEPPSR